MNSINLDKLKAELKIITFLGKDFDVGYIPAGLAIPLAQRYQEILKKQTELAGGEGLEHIKALQENHAAELEKDAIEFVAFFCSWFDQSYTSGRIAQEATKQMVDIFFQEIFIAIAASSPATSKEDSLPEQGSKKKSAGSGPSTNFVESTT